MICNICIIQGEDVLFNFSPIDADNTYSSSGVLMLLDNVKHTLESVDIDSNGVIAITMTNSETLSLDPSIVYYYRIRLESISGEVSFPYEGTFRVMPTITRI